MKFIDVVSNIATGRQFTNNLKFFHPKASSLVDGLKIDCELEIPQGIDTPKSRHIDNEQGGAQKSQRLIKSYKRHFPPYFENTNPKRQNSNNCSLEQSVLEEDNTSKDVSLKKPLEITLNQNSLLNYNPMRKLYKKGKSARGSVTNLLHQNNSSCCSTNISQINNDLLKGSTIYRKKSKTNTPKETDKNTKVKISIGKLKMPQTVKGLTNGLKESFSGISTPIERPKSTRRLNYQKHQSFSILNEKELSVPRKEKSPNPSLTPKSITKPASMLINYPNVISPRASGKHIEHSLHSMFSILGIKNKREDELKQPNSAQTISTKKSKFPLEKSGLENNISYRNFAGESNRAIEQQEGAEGIKSYRYQTKYQQKYREDNQNELKKVLKHLNISKVRDNSRIISNCVGAHQTPKSKKSMNGANQHIKTISEVIDSSKDMTKVEHENVQPESILKITKKSEKLTKEPGLTGVQTIVQKTNMQTKQISLASNIKNSLSSQNEVEQKNHKHESRTERNKADGKINQEQYSDKPGKPSKFSCNKYAIGSIHNELISKVSIIDMAHQKKDHNIKMNLKHRKNSRSLFTGNHTNNILRNVEIPQSLSSMPKKSGFISNRSPASIPITNVEIHKDSKKGHSLKNSSSLQNLKEPDYTMSSQMGDFDSNSEYEQLRKKLRDINKESFKMYNCSVSTTLDHYRITKIIGKGSFGIVYLAIHLLTGFYVAIKTIEKRYIQDEYSRRKVLQEIEILRLINHPNVNQLLEIFEDDECVFMVLEYASNGDLLSFIKRKGRISEDVARRLFVQVVDGLRHCHSKQILHRDVKPDNILLDQDFNVKLCDFGVSRFIVAGELINEQCGTPAYIAPEIIHNEGYEGFYADIWSLGVSLYAAVTGSIPFLANNLEELHKAIFSCQYTFPEYLTPECQDVIRKMIVLDPYSRISIAEIRSHEWFKINNTKYDELNTPNFKGRSSANPSYSTNTSTVDFDKDTNTNLNIIEDVVKMTEELGYPKEYIINSIHQSRCNHASACYHLLSKEFR